MAKKKKFKDQKFYQRHSSGLIWAALFAVILCIAAIRIHLLSVPLERDEGEYAYAGQLILQGVPPYEQVYNMKMPGIYVVYALIMALFGQTHEAIHTGLLLINAATAIVIFLLGRRLFSPLAGITAAATFGLLSLGQEVQGIFANAEHFVILPAIGGLLLLKYAVDSDKWSALLTGSILLGTGFIIKQHAAAFILFSLLYLLFYSIRDRKLNKSYLAARMIIFLSGVLLPFALTCLILWKAGVFDKFWFWTFDYAREYVSSESLPEGLEALKSTIVRIAGASVLVWILAGIGTASLFWNTKTRSNALFVIGFLLFSFLAVCPGLYFRSHYFILLLPSIALLAGAGIDSMNTFLSQKKSNLLIKMMPVILLSAVLVHSVWQQRHFFFFMSPAVASRAAFGRNPFPESIEIARFIRENSASSDRIAVIGSEPQIYFYSDRRSATGYIYTYALMEKHPYALKMQEEMVKELEKNRPEFLVYVNISFSWLMKPDSKTILLEWFQENARNNYELVGVADLVRDDLTVYQWGRKALSYMPQSSTWISVHKQKT